MSIPIPIPRQESTSEFHALGEKEEVEYFFASDASAIIEHTNQVIYLEVCFYYSNHLRTRKFAGL